MFPSIIPESVLLSSFFDTIFLYKVTRILIDSSQKFLKLLSINSLSYIIQHLLSCLKLYFLLVFWVIFLCPFQFTLKIVVITIYYALHCNMYQVIIYTSFIFLYIIILYHGICIEFLNILFTALGSFRFYTECNIFCDRVSSIFHSINFVNICSIKLFLVILIFHMCYSLLYLPQTSRHINHHSSSGICSKVLALKSLAIISEPSKLIAKLSIMCSSFIKEFIASLGVRLQLIIVHSVVVMKTETILPLLAIFVSFPSGFPIATVFVTYSSYL